MTPDVATPDRSGNAFPWHRWAPWLLLIVGVATFANSIENPFIFDDRLPIEKSEYIKHLWPLGAPNQSAPAGRPVIMLSLAINYAIGGLDPRGYHVFNIGVHILAAMTLFGVVRRTLEGEGLRDRFGRSAGPIALACALLWMVHPIQTEVIDYVVQRTSSMMSLFYLVTFYCAIRAADSSRRSLWYAAASLAAILGMMCKESMATAPFLLVLYDVIFLRGSIGGVLRRRWPLYAGVSLCLVVFAVIMANAPRAEVVTFDTRVTWLEYALNQFIVIAHYFRLVLWPYPLVLDYGPTLPVPIQAVVAPAIFILLLVAASLFALFRWPRAGFLGIAAFVILAPSSSILPLVPEVGAERRMYLPLAPIVVLLVLLARRLLANRFPRGDGDAPQAWPSVITLVLVTATLAVVSFRRNIDYRSRVSIWTTAARAAPRNSRAHYNLGVVLVDEGRLDEADPSFRRAIEIKPDYHEACYNLGLSLAKRGRFEEAVTQFAAALRVDPDNADVHNNMGNALNALGRTDAATRHFEDAIRLDPGKATARNNLGTVLAAQGHYAEAIAQFREALAIDDANADTNRNLALALFLSGERGEGRRYLEEAARLDPTSIAPWSSAARAIARHPDPAQRDMATVIEFAQKAVDMTGGREAIPLAELAQYLAMTGRFGEALTTMETAIARAEAAGNQRLAEQLRARAEQYRRRM